VDTALIARAPRKLLLAGIGDAISKKFEVAQCHAAQGPNIFGGLGTRAALALADLCFETLLAHADGALAALERQSPDDSLEAIVEASVLLSGLCFENGGLSIAHSMTRGLSALPGTADELHGLQVAYGTMVQWHLENRLPSHRPAPEPAATGAAPCAHRCRHRHPRHPDPDRAAHAQLRPRADGAEPGAGHPGPRGRAALSI